MKKIICVLFFITIIFINYEKNDSVIIPKDSIRFRLIANSNSIEDQKIKKTIKKDLESTFIKNIKTNNLETTENSIIDSLNVIDEVMKKYDVNYNISYGNNYFPQKEYKGVTYPEGNYKSLVITLGKGKGENWWCVLFPPLCLLESTEDKQDIIYKSYVKEILNKTMNNK